jgi:hypothetical protein
MITISLLRKGSRGISATIENAQHHAQPCLPIIQRLESIIHFVGLTRDFEWVQGNNIHIITNWCGDSICFRPYRNDKTKHWGIDVNAKISRSTEMRLMTLMTSSSLDRFEHFLKSFVTKKPKNDYGTSGNE